jgi:hypothetical protein
MEEVKSNGGRVEYPVPLLSVKELYLNGELAHGTAMCKHSFGYGGHYLTNFRS